MGQESTSTSPSPQPPPSGWARELLWWLIVILPKNGASRVVNILVRLPLPPLVLEPLIYVFSRFYGINMDEVDRPRRGFKNFQEFFVRPLKAECRTIASHPLSIVSPCDGVVYNCGSLGKDTTIEQIKGVDYSLEELLGEESTHQYFVNGHYATIYLSPRHYHRVHTPFGGTVERIRHIPGFLWPVNEMGLHRVKGLFCENERVAIWLHTPFGKMVVVMVGALNVGCMRLSFDSSFRTNINCRRVSSQHYHKVKLDRGDELGRFEMGSTVILIMPPQTEATHTLHPGAALEYGEEIARFVGGQ